MLYHLAVTRDDDQFKAILRDICNSFWPIKDYKDEGKKATWKPDSNSIEQINLIEKTLNGISKKVENKQLYKNYSTGNNNNSKSLPFIKRYHHYFLKRKWQYPYTNPSTQLDDLFELYPTSNDRENNELYPNCSANWGDFNHFVNVVAATARFIQYFSEEKLIQELFNDKSIHRDEYNYEKTHELAMDVLYNSDNKLRIFRLMLAAYYHDLGKTVDYHRHGMEGANILVNHTTDAVYQFNDILALYTPINNTVPGKLLFEKDDLLQVSNLVFYHDQFGTLGTGEAGYLRFVDLLHRIHRTSVHEDFETQKETGKQCLFDLWVLNLADIMVSLEEKDKAQFNICGDYVNSQCINPSLLLDEESTSTARIKDFLNDKKSKVLVKDFCIALHLLEQNYERKYSDDIEPLEQHALKYAKKHTIDRVQRMLRSLLVDNTDQYIPTIESKLNKISYEEGAFCKGANISNTKPIEGLLSEIKSFPEEKWYSIISRCIFSIGDYKEFTRRICWIGQMDYAYGFFKKIVEQSLVYVNIELIINNSEDPENINLSNRHRIHTGWIYKEKNNNDLESKFILTKNAEFFVENYTSTLVQILEHLLFREDKFDRIRNLEFFIARQRLSDEKIDRIIGLDGPFRTRHSMQLALESIFIW